MGYYSEMDFAGKLKPNKVEELKKKIKEIKEKSKKSKKLEGFYWYFLEDAMITKNENGWWIDWDDYDGKWYFDEEFAKFIAPYVENQDMIFHGEDGETWGYRFQDGKILILEAVMEVKGELV